MAQPTTHIISAYPLVAPAQAEEAIGVAQTVLRASWERYQLVTHVTPRRLASPFDIHTRRLNLRLVSEDGHEERFTRDAERMLALLQKDRPQDMWILLGATSYPGEPCLARHASARLVLTQAMLKPLSTAHQKALGPQKVTLVVEKSKQHAKPDRYMDPNKLEERMALLAFSQWEDALAFTQPYFRSIHLQQAWRDVLASSGGRKDRL